LVLGCHLGLAITGELSVLRETKGQGGDLGRWRNSCTRRAWGAPGGAQARAGACSTTTLPACSRTSWSAMSK
jgi:hypothetical protein